MIIIIIIIISVVRLSPVGTAATIGLLYQSQMMDDGDCGEIGGKLAGETEVLGENLLNATLSTTNPTWPDPGSNPGRHGGKPATNRLSYDTASTFIKKCIHC
jgi:hypothetical protein